MIGRQGSWSSDSKIANVVLSSRGPSDYWSYIRTSLIGQMAGEKKRDGKSSGTDVTSKKADEVAATTD